MCGDRLIYLSQCAFVDKILIVEQTLYVLFLQACNSTELCLYVIGGFCACVGWVTCGGEDCLILTFDSGGCYIRTDTDCPTLFKLKDTV